MQPRTLDQVLSSLDSTYNPQIDSVRQRQALIPQQVQAEEQGLQAKQGQAYDDILGGARRRGLGFAGIPLGEQAKYSATEYMPALARLKQGAREQAMSLEDAILGIYERRNTQGQSIYEGERNFAEQQRQFNESQRMAEANARRASQANAVDNSWLEKLLNQNNTQNAQQGADPARDEVVSVIGNRNYSQLLRYYQALTKSAGYGNKVDAKKLEYMAALQPGLFKNGQLNQTRIQALIQSANGGGSVTGFGATGVAGTVKAGGR